MKTFFFPIHLLQCFSPAIPDSLSSNDSFRMLGMKTANFTVHVCWLIQGFFAIFAKTICGSTKQIATIDVLATLLYLAFG